MCHCLLVVNVNHAIDEWRRCLSACLDAEGGHFEHYRTYDCYSQNNNVKMAAVNLITKDDFFCSLLL